MDGALQTDLPTQKALPFAAAPTPLLTTLRQISRMDDSGDGQGDPPEDALTMVSHHTV
jgi:hypothetical protein